MQYFLLQTAALMLAAYFLGALAACLIRRTFFPHTIAIRDTYAETGALRAPAGGTTMVVAPTTAPPRPAPRIEPTPRPGVTAAEANKFERALTGEGKPTAPATTATVAAPRPATVAPPAPAVQPPRPAPIVAATPAPVVAPAPAPVPAAAKPAPTVTPAQPTAAAKPASAPPISVPPQAIWPTMRNQVVPPKPAAPTVTKPQPAPAAAAPAAPARPAAAAPTTAAGQPVQVPAATAAPVIAAASAAATAAAAAAAAATRVTAQPQVVMPVAGGSGGATTVSAPRPAAPPAAPPPAVPAAAPLASDVLTRIRAIDADLQQRLYGAGVRRYSDIAAWSPADVGRITSAFGLEGRITRENWIEQAQVLAKGGVTDYARRLAEGAPLTEVPPPPLTPKAVPSPAPAPQPAPPATASKPASPASVPAAGPAVSAAASTPAASAAAAASAASIAAASAAAAAARQVSAAHDVEPRPAKLADAIRDQAEKTAGDTARGARGDLAGLRSVRSEILRKPEAERAGAPDDLKRIRGIGVLIEKKLNSMGITGYDQVANWTSQDIDRISQVLDFKGRIERENWVEQARILASGGQTEFSRRVDRGEVESSRTQKT